MSEPLHWYLPGMGMQFALVSMGSALRGTGIIKPTMIVQMLTVMLNIILAPVLIAGWGTGHPLGIAGAGLATSLSIAAGVVLLWVYFTRLEKYVSVNPGLWRPQFGVGTRVMQAVFLPAMALAFSAPAVAGQNFGAGLPDRVRNTFRWTALMSSVFMLSLSTRILTFVIPVIWVSQTPGFKIEEVWILSVAAVCLQALISYYLLRREFGRRLLFSNQHITL